MNSRSPRVAVIVLLLLTPLSCSKRTLVPVEGVITLDGIPLSGAFIYLVPKDPNSTRTAFADSRSDGSFQLTTFRNIDGAMPGQYRVIVRKIEPLRGAEREAQDEDFRERVRKALNEREVMGKSLIPLIYGDADRTPLEVEILSAETIELRLSSDFPLGRGSGAT